MKVIHLSPSRNKGKTYEATYLGWIEFFKEIAHANSRVMVRDYPRSWTQFIRYMGHTSMSYQLWFLEDSLVLFNEQRSEHIYGNYEVERRIVEIASTMRPELAHALYLWDTQWHSHPNAVERMRFRENQKSKEFVVTCNASFFRKEVMDYFKLLDEWTPPIEYYGKQVILCPCAADKPYPAPLHKAIRCVAPEAYLIVVTGVLGVVPESLWSVAPNYDAGIPYNERVRGAVAQFFSRFPLPRGRRPIIYSDYLHRVIEQGLSSAGQAYASVFDTTPAEEGYMDLMDSMNLERLKNAYGRLSA